MGVSRSLRYRYALKLVRFGRDYRPWRNAWTPFLRRFTNERARELAESKRLYERVRARHSASRWANYQEAVFGVSHSILEWAAEHAEVDTQSPLFDPLLQAQLDVLEAERVIFGFPDAVEWSALDLAELVELRNFLRAKDRFLSREQHVIDELTIKLGSVLIGIIANLPELGRPSEFTVPLIDLMDKPNEVVDKLIGTFGNDDGLFVDLNSRLYENVCYASNLTPGAEHKKPLITADQSELPARQLVETYLKGTPYRDLFLTPVPFSFMSSRTSHMHIVGGSGAGKTQLLQAMIMDDLRSDNPPAMIIVTPRDIDHPPAINIFDVNQKRFDKYDPATREQVVAGVIETFDYLFSGLLGADLSAKQSVIFRYLARLMLALPMTLGRNATILDLLCLMDDAAPYLEAMKSLPLTTLRHLLDSTLRQVLAIPISHLCYSRPKLIPTTSKRSSMACG